MRVAVAICTHCWFAYFKGALLNKNRKIEVKQILSQMLVSSMAKKQTSANTSRIFQYKLPIKSYTKNRLAQGPD